jgi:hypothetical protein
MAMRMQQVRKRCRDFENIRADFLDEEQNGGT